MSSSVEVVVVTRALESMQHCTHCQVFIDQAGGGTAVHEEDFRAYPDDVREEFARVSALVIRLLETFPGRVAVRVVNAFSPEGLWLALRRGARRYPTWLIGQRKIVGYNWEQIAQAVQEALSEHQPAEALTS